MKNNQSTVENTNLFQDGLKHYNLLLNKGYTQKQHFPYSENFLLKKLQHKLISKFTNNDPSPDFLIRIQGFFNNKEDELNYNLFYSVNRTNNTLSLDSLVAELNDKRICYPLKDENDLPPAINVWKHLTNLLKEERVHIIYPKEKIKLLLREQDDILKSIGYYKTFLDNRTFFINRELRTLLQSNLHEYEPKILPINIRLQLNSYDSIHCRFQYSFDPVHIKLTLESITAKSGVLEQEYPFEKIQSQNLNLQKISDELKQQNRLLNAQQISKASDRSGMKAMLKHLQKRP
ncbi:hypothetical protein A3860_17925 [Niastella vici]|uniref:Uncharacterized protein n=1 Tax=Niastella vici TaxID=1703345 RepID=A0A1V9G4J5_9BACT|nr:hypothetical protein [Niastella vici]OQP65543.1 hypothetical protein A3860_17925 [Niastella vici]